MSVFADTLRFRLEEARIPFCDEQIGLCERYFTLVAEANTRFNLTRIAGEKEAAERHFADAAMLLKFYRIPRGARVIDVGSGAGFPGIPVKILKPDIELTLLDSAGKKIDFIRKAAGELRIEADAVCGRAEEAGRGALREKFHAALSRAVAPLNMLLELCAPLVGVGGVVAAWKGASYPEELERSRDALKTLGCDVSGVFPVGEGAIILIDKQKAAPGLYPRRYSRIKSSPL